MDTLDIPVELGALKSAPVWETHRRGKNWCASIRKDPSAPGGIGRAFWERARGEFYYMVPAGIACPLPVEFGGDYISGGGNRSRSRWYGVLVSVSATLARFEACATAVQAIARAEELRMADPPAVRAFALEGEVPAPTAPGLEPDGDTGRLIEGVRTAIGAVVALAMAC